MNNLAKITAYFVVFILIFGIQSTQAQSNIDSNRMNRDLRIMENVLQEMFKTQWSEQGNTVMVHPGPGFSFGPGDDIRGTYLPDYGVIFTIPGGTPAFVMLSDADDKNFVYSFQYGNGDSEAQVNKETVINRIVEFLRDYGSTIGQLSADDNVMVLYNAHNDDPHIRFLRSENKSGDKRKPIPTISVVASKRDLNAYRTGKINESQFRDRLNISTMDPEDSKQMDMKVMANIFETAFDNSGEESFRVIGSVSYLKLDNFGALFSFDARYSSRSTAPGFIDVQQIMDDAKEEVDNARLRIEFEKEIRDSGDTDQTKDELKKQQAERKEKAIAAYKEFVSSLRGYIIDYGRTLRSVNSDQYVMVSVTLNGRYKEIPERIDLQIKKSILESVDKGQSSREQALDQIRVREY